MPHQLPARPEPAHVDQEAPTVHICMQTYTCHLWRRDTESDPDRDSSSTQLRCLMTSPSVPHSWGDALVFISAGVIRLGPLQENLASGDGKMFL